MKFSRNQTKKRLELCRSFWACITALLVAVLLPFGIMRGLDEVEVNRITSLGVPEGDGEMYWQYRDLIVVMCRMKEREPVFFSNRWHKLLKELKEKR